MTSKLELNHMQLALEHLAAAEYHMRRVQRGMQAKTPEAQAELIIEDAQMQAWRMLPVSATYAMQTYAVSQNVHSNFIPAKVWDEMVATAPEFKWRQ